MISPEMSEATEGVSYEIPRKISEAFLHSLAKNVIIVQKNNRINFLKIIETHFWRNPWKTI